jgi:hypothetical protein
LFYGETNAVEKERKFPIESKGGEPSVSRRVRLSYQEVSNENLRLEKLLYILSSLKKHNAGLQEKESLKMEGEFKE